jgi:hypothetical protein
MKKILIGLVFMLGIILPQTGLVKTAVTYADTAKGTVCEGLGLTSSDGNKTCDAPAGSTSVDSLIGTVVSILSYLIGAVAVIMIMIGSFKYVTSGGVSNKVGSAKTTLTYALIGLAIAALAQVLVRFVLTKATT